VVVTSPQLPIYQEGNNTPGVHIFVPNLQVSAIGVWATPLKIALRAAALPVTFPSGQLLEKAYQSGIVKCIDRQLLVAVSYAAQLLKEPAPSLLCMTQEQLQGERQQCQTTGAGSSTWVPVRVCFNIA
jgi:hypothetical protein